MKKCRIETSPGQDPGIQQSPAGRSQELRGEATRDRPRLPLQTGEGPSGTHQPDQEETRKEQKRYFQTSSQQG